MTFVKRSEGFAMMEKSDVQILQPLIAVPEVRQQSVEHPSKYQSQNQAQIYIFCGL